MRYERSYRLSSVCPDIDRWTTRGKLGSPATTQEPMKASGSIIFNKPASERTKSLNPSSKTP